MIKKSLSLLSAAAISTVLVTTSAFAKTDISNFTKASIYTNGNGTVSIETNYSDDSEDSGKSMAAQIIERIRAQLNGDDSSSSSSSNASSIAPSSNSSDSSSVSSNPSSSNTVSSSVMSSMSSATGASLSSSSISSNPSSSTVSSTSTTSSNSSSLASSSRSNSSSSWEDRVHVRIWERLSRHFSNLQDIFRHLESIFDRGNNDNDNDSGSGSVIINERFDARIRASEEVPTNNSNGRAEGTFTLSGADLMYTISNVRNLSSPITGAHFHHAEEGVNGPVVEPIALSGSTTMVTGTWQDLSTDELNWLRNEEIYVNIHTVTYPGGEIRGQIE